MRGSDYAEFRTFAAVAESGSFVRASRQLGLTASAVSQTIRVLEQRLGARLLHRTTRRVSLTDAGIRLLARLQPVFQELDAATREIEDLKQRPSGTLRIVTPRIAYVDYLEPILAGFHHILSGRHPGHHGRRLDHGHRGARIRSRNSPGRAARRRGGGGAARRLTPAACRRLAGLSGAAWSSGPA